MQPFNLRCPKCQSSLKVSSPKLLGKTLPCPKCATPIKVIESERVVVKPTTNHPIDSGAMTKIGDEKWHAAAGNDQDTDGLFSDLNVDRIRFRDSDPFGEEQQSSTIAPIEALETISNPIPLSSKEWTSSSARKSNQILLVTMLGVGGTIIALGLFFVFVRYLGKDNDKVSQNTNTQTTTTKTEDPDTSVKPPETRAVDSQQTPVAKDATKTGWDSVLNANPEPEVAVNTVPTGETPGTPTESGTKEPIATETTQTNSLDNPPNTPQENPLTATPNPNETNVFNVPRGLWDPSVNDLIAEAGIDPAEANPAGNETIDLGELVHPPAATDVVVDDVYSTRIVSLKATQRPLGEVLLVLSQLTGAGFGVDVDSFEAAGISLSQPIDIDVADINVAQFFQTVMEPLHLQVRNNPNGLPIVFVDPSIAQSLMPDVIPLEGLVEAKDVSAFEQLLKGALPDEAHLARIEGTNVLCDATATPLQKYRIYSLIMRLRNALGLPIDSKYPDKWFATGGNFGDVLGKLSQPGTGIVERARPVSQLLTKVAADANLNLFFDWPSLWSHGFTPSIRAISVINKRNFRQISNRFIEDYALTLAVMNDSTLILTTPESRRLHGQVLVIPIREGQTIESIRDLASLISPIDVNRVSRLYVEQFLNHPWAIIRVCPPSPEDLDDLSPLFR